MSSVRVPSLSALDPTDRMFCSRLDRVRNYLHLKVKKLIARRGSLIPIYLSALFGFLTISSLPLCASRHDNLELENIKQSERKGESEHDSRKIILIVILRTAIPAESTRLQNYHDHKKSPPRNCLNVKYSATRASFSRLCRDVAKQTGSVSRESCEKLFKLGTIKTNSTQKKNNKKTRYKRKV